jgi:hypothetical protein
MSAATRVAGVTSFSRFIRALFSESCIRRNGDGFDDAFAPRLERVSLHRNA